jgi:hypothetical protein
MPAKKKKIAKRKAVRSPKKNKIVRKVTRKKQLPKKLKKFLLPKNKIIGIITHYFPHVKAAVLKVKIPVTVGDGIWIKGHTSDFKQKITSMQIDRDPINKAKKNDEIGLMVEKRVRRRDVVYKA